MFSESRNGATVRLLAVHTAEGCMTCADLKHFFDNEPEATAGSSHASAEESGALWGPEQGFVPYDQAAWTLRSGNHISENIELCAFAHYSRQDWLDRGKLLDACAQWLATRAHAHNIPLVKLSPAQVAAGDAGVIGHADWTQGMHDGSHYDPGPEFPWDVVIAKAQALEKALSQPQKPSTPPPAPTPAPAPAGPSGPVSYGERSARVLHFQQDMVRTFPSYNQYTPTGFFGDLTKAGLAEFQFRVGITGPDANGTIIGPRTTAALARFGIRVPR